MSAMSEHVALPIDKYGHGPVPEAEAEDWTCWCQPDGTPARIKFNGGRGMTLCPYTDIAIIDGFPPGWEPGKKAHIMKSLHDMQDEVYEVNRANGWFDSERTFGEDVALLHSEVSEMLEAYREGGLEDATPPYVFGGNVPKPDGVGSEAADVLIRLLDTCHRYGIDLESEYERKVEYNKTRGPRHGGKIL